MIVHIVGRPGSGKTTLRLALASDLGIPSVDIADQPGHLTDPRTAWASLNASLTTSIVVETAGTSAYERGFGRGREVLTIVCAAAERVRSERLSKRPEVETETDYVARMLAIAMPTVSGVPWDGSAPIGGSAYLSLLDHVKRCVAPVEVSYFDA